MLLGLDKRLGFTRRVVFGFSVFALCGLLFILQVGRGSNFIIKRRSISCICSIFALGEG